MQIIKSARGKRLPCLDTLSLKRRGFSDEIIQYKQREHILD